MVNHTRIGSTLQLFWLRSPMTNSFSVTVASPGVHCRLTSLPSRSSRVITVSGTTGK